MNEQRWGPDRTHWSEETQRVLDLLQDALDQDLRALTLTRPELDRLLGALWTVGVVRER